MMTKPAAVFSAGLAALASGAGAEPVLAPADEGFVATFLVRKKPDMTFEAFRSYQIGTHVPIALQLPGLRHYRISFFPPEADADQPVDAIVEVTFATAEAYQAAMGSAEGQRALSDLPNMLDMEAMQVLTAGARYEARAKPK